MAYTPDEKRTIVERIARLYVDENMPIEDACIRVGVDKLSFYNWTRKREINEINELHEIWQNARKEAIDRFDEIAFEKCRSTFLKKVVPRLRRKTIRAIPDPEQQNSNDFSKPKLVIVHVDYEEVEGSDSLLIEGLRAFHPKFQEANDQTIPTNIDPKDFQTDWTALGIPLAPEIE